MDGKIVAEFDKNGREKIRVTLTEYKGKKLIDLRTYWQDDATNEWKPGKGLALSRDRIPELKAAILAAEGESEADATGEDV